MKANKKLRAFAKQHGYRLVAMSFQTPEGGEFNMEGCVTIEDSLRIRELAAEIIELMQKTDPELGDRPRELLEETP